jgi:hypothetical protein
MSFWMGRSSIGLATTREGGSDPTGFHPGFPLEVLADM